ncbi:MAG TPA: S26 family signal peptidase [Mycobacteriales bacterium]|nr:S26 family signal peptidase [Mycobacteriales bacterium]
MASGPPTPEALRRYPGSRVPAAVVPAGHVVVVGDNPNSQDSRQLGYVPVRAIAGRVHPHRPPADRAHRTGHPPIASRRPSRRR